MPAERFRYPTLTAVVIANMVGTGVFTSLGFQLLDIRSGFVILMLWAVGGLVALCGALCYAELGAALPRSGGEYNFLSRIFHSSAGFVSGWVSCTVGFAGPMALASMTFAAYAGSVFPSGIGQWGEKLLAAGLLVALTITHGTSHRTSSNTQLVFTVLKVGIIALFIVGTVWIGSAPQPVNFLPAAGDGSLMLSNPFAVSLIYVSFAYSGWNAATYLSGELENPQRTLPGILIVGTSVVTVLYLGLNFSFLYAAPMDSMAGQVEVGVIAAQSAFGETVGRFTGITLALLLISTVSAMTIAGPRVIQVIGEDFPAVSALGKTNSNGIPAKAIYTQSAIALVFIFSSTFESILVFSGFTLALNTFVTVSGVFVLRYREPQLERPFKTTLFPLPPLIYLLLIGWTLVFTLISRPVEALFSLGLIGSGLVFYFLSTRVSAERT
ncbi:MAG: amino acid permease [Gammaproteobacteria bacterium]|nr:amino acid permease [Gammaproteobacteria bacterium]